MGEPHGENTRGTLLFLFSLEGSCGGPKRVLFFSCPWVGHMDITLEINFCLGLSHGHNTKDKLLFGFSLQSGCGGPKKFYFFFLLGGCATCTET